MNQEIKLGKLNKYEYENKFGILALALMLGLGVLTKLTEGGLFNEEFVYAFMGERVPVLFIISKILAFIGSAKFLIPAITAAVIFCILKKKHLFALGILLASLGVFILNSVAKFIFQRPRPEDFMLAIESSFSFPSGHAMTNTCLYLFLAYYFSRYVDNSRKKHYYVIAITFSILMAMSRVHLGVHYPSDVVGGILGGYFFYIITVNILERFNRKIDSEE